MRSSSRQALAFEPAAGTASTSRFDLILDLSGEAPLLPAHAKRDGYFRPDPGNPGAVQRALFDLTDLVGEFEKPRYVDFNAELCAHARSAPDRLHALPRGLPGGGDPARRRRRRDRPVHLRRLRRLPQRVPDRRCRPTPIRRPPRCSSGCARCLRRYRQAGGERPVLLVHDDAHGGELISLLSRFGRGLPANVIPFALNEVTQLGLDAILGALAYGAARMLVLVPPKRRTSSRVSRHSSAMPTRRSRASATAPDVWSCCSRRPGCGRGAAARAWRRPAADARGDASCRWATSGR